MICLNTNTINKSSTQYLCDINSLVKFNRQYLLSSGTGLYQYDGDTDNGNPVEAYFITATMDFGESNDKRLRYVYLSLEATGDLVMSIKTEKVSEIDFPVLVDVAAGQQDIRIPVSRSLHGRFWTIKVSNTSSGADFSIDEIKVLPIIRNWRH